MSTTASCTTITTTTIAASKCSKCNKETVTTTDAVLCSACSPALEAATVTATPTAALDAPLEEDAVKMDIDTDLTTTETLDEIDELEKPTTKTATTTAAATKTETKDKEEQQQPQVAEKAEELQLATPETATEAEPTQRVGKITRSSLNGQRSPTVMKRLRKSTRSTRFKAKLTGRGANASTSGTNGHSGQSGSAAGGSTNASAGSSGKAHGKLNASSGMARNRRTLFKRPAQKTPRMQAATRYVKSVFYKGSYMQIGDIVSIVDSEQQLYYAQIRGLLVDAYCEKSAFLTWLIPTQDSPDPQEGFDPATYLIGPDEQLSRKLCYLEFIMHAPSNYYFDRTTPFPLPDVDDYTTHRSGGFIWTRLPVVRRERKAAV
ncbi:hypothetical protein KR093_011422 [Drosophila rubida]|uniref:GATA zinc finger domain-containing protein 1 n=1 Tax=Drosophila rubida TaxID=30044 RepID=A0AAD4PRQ0_9MUSC|nr:hypothetical protein KR093_011422 [Drosophila rubida]